MVIYLTLHKVSNTELVKKWYEKADARAETLRPGAPAYLATMGDLLALAQRQKVLETTIMVHKRVPKEQKDTLKAVKDKEQRIN
jgi:hypothetical protein